MNGELPRSGEVVSAADVQAALVSTVMNGGQICSPVLLLDDILDEGRALATIRALRATQD